MALCATKAFVHCIHDDYFHSLVYPSTFELVLLIQASAVLIVPTNLRDLQPIPCIDRLTYKDGTILLLWVPTNFEEG